MGVLCVRCVVCPPEFSVLCVVGFSQLQVPSCQTLGSLTDPSMIQGFRLGPRLQSPQGLQRCGLGSGGADVTLRPRLVSRVLKQAGRTPVAEVEAKVLQAGQSHDQHLVSCGPCRVEVSELRNADTLDLGEHCSPPYRT